MSFIQDAERNLSGASVDSNSPWYRIESELQALAATIGEANCKYFYSSDATRTKSGEVTPSLPSVIPSDCVEHSDINPNDDQQSTSIFATAFIRVQPIIPEAHKELLIGYSDQKNISHDDPLIIKKHVVVTSLPFVTMIVSIPLGYLDDTVTATDLNTTLPNVVLEGWAPPQILATVAKELPDLYCGDEILWTWWDHVATRLFPLLIEATRQLCQQSQPKPTLGASSSPSSPAVVLSPALFTIAPTEFNGETWRVNTTHGGYLTSWHTIMEAEASKTALTWIQCAICLEEIKGTKLIKCWDCGRRSMCVDCLKRMCEVNIDEGTVEEIKCVCTSSLSPSVVADIVDVTRYEKYERLSLNKALNRMGDLVYCPRCETPTIRNVKDNLAICPQCTFTFCSDCRQAWHAPSMLCDTVTESTPAQKEMRTTKGNNDKLVSALKNQAQNLDFIRSTCKRCPFCRVFIERTVGCDSMYCTNCTHVFCYRCEQPSLTHGPSCQPVDTSSRSRAEFVSQELFDDIATNPQNAEQVLSGLGTQMFLARLNQTSSSVTTFTPDVKRITCPHCHSQNWGIRDPAVPRISNLRSCVSCRLHFCALCLEKLHKLKNKASHFVPPSPCQQH